MQIQLSYATINVLASNLAEVIVNKNIVMTLEMVEEFEEFLDRHFSQPFALLVNKINTYDYSFEAMSCLASNQNLVAMAVINYDDIATDPINKVMKIRAMDKLNIQLFSGFELGWQEGKVWLENQLTK